MLEKSGVIICTLWRLPFGSPISEMETLYETRLKPFVSVLYNTPSVRSLLYISGPVLSWIERTKPELFAALSEMIDRRQIEMLGGGFYEPAFPFLEPADRDGQVELLSTYLRKAMGKRPSGCFMDALSWEQSLVNVLVKSGLTYTLLERGFVSKNALYTGGGPFISEDRGRVLTIFPMEMAASTGEALDFIEKHAKKGETLTVFPQFEAGEADVLRFFTEILQKEDKITTTLPSILPSSVLKTQKTFEKHYFSGDSAKRNLITNPVAASLYARMMFLHALIDTIRGDKERKKNALEEMYKAQSCYVFYENPSQPPLVLAAWKALITAERIAREEIFHPNVTSYDINFDGNAECVFQGEAFNCCMEKYGLSELDWLQAAWNYQAAGGLSFADCLSGKPVPWESVELDKPHCRALFHAIFEKNVEEDGKNSGFPFEKFLEIDKNRIISKYRRKKSNFPLLNCENEEEESRDFTVSFTLCFPVGVKVNEISNDTHPVAIEFQDFTNENSVRLSFDAVFEASLSLEERGRLTIARVTLSTPRLPLSDFTITFEVRD